MSDVQPPVPAPPTPEETTGPQTKFENVTFTAERDALAGRWYIYANLGSVKWRIAERKLGGLDDDLQEAATPGFKEARAVRYAQETGQPRLEPGPGA